MGLSLYGSYTFIDLAMLKLKNEIFFTIMNTTVLTQKSGSLCHPLGLSVADKIFDLITALPVWPFLMYSTSSSPVIDLFLGPGFQSQSHQLACLPFWRENYDL
jgi:hypothetical protein